MLRGLILACAVLLLAGCSSTRDSRTMRSGIAPNPRYTPPDESRPAPNAPPPTIGESAWQSEAARWIGTRYRYGGTTREGMDCSGLVSTMYVNVARIKLPRTSLQQSRTGVAIPKDQLRPGDLVFFETSSRPEVNHSGIYLGNGRFIHSSSSRGVIYTQLDAPYYVKQYRGARRILR